MYPSFHFEQLHQCKVVLTPGMQVPGKVSSLIWYPSLCRTKDKSFKYCQFSIHGSSMSNYFEQRLCPSYAILIAFIYSFFFVLLSKALHGHVCVFSVTCSFFSIALDVSMWSISYWTNTTTHTFSLQQSYCKKCMTQNQLSTYLKSRPPKQNTKRSFHYLPDIVIARFSACRFPYISKGNSW